jgi:transcription elongation factor Elf1
MITYNGGYHNYLYCPICEHRHTVKITDNIDGYMCEATTVCESCGHIDHWAYGYYWDCIEGD